MFQLTFANSSCKSHTGKFFVVFNDIKWFLSSVQRSNVAVALKPITEKTTTPANIEVPQLVKDTKMASR